MSTSTTRNTRFSKRSLLCDRSKPPPPGGGPFLSCSAACHHLVAPLRGTHTHHPHEKKKRGLCDHHPPRKKKRVFVAPERPHPRPRHKKKRVSTRHQEVACIAPGSTGHRTAGRNRPSGTYNDVAAWSLGRRPRWEPWRCMARQEKGRLSCCQLLSVMTLPPSRRPSQAQQHKHRPRSTLRKKKKNV